MGLDNVEKCCANCEYWEPYNNKLDKGQCHRYPPSVPSFAENERQYPDGIFPMQARTLLLYNTMFVDNPFTFAENWCGEFMPLPYEECRIIE